MRRARWRRAFDTVDARLHIAGPVHKQAKKVFPDHWSFMLGELALYNFLILVVTGTYLAFFFHASDTPVAYKGSYLPLRNVRVSEAYSSVLHISFDVRGGLLIRQIHHWAALLFVGAILVHACRVFFTGAFRRPRDINWVVGLAMLMLSIAEGFAGYSLPDDLLSGTGLRIAYSILESIPIVGSYVAVFFFGGQFPGDGEIFTRLFIIHVFLLPLMLLGLIGAHLLIVWRQKHTQFAGKEKTEQNVVGSHLYPGYAVKSLGLFFGVFSLLSFLASYAQINPIWLYGPYDPSTVSAGSQPDWYMLWLEGSLRLMPPLSSRFAGHTIDWNVFFPAVIVPLLLFGSMLVYPFLERWITRDRAQHNLLDRPRDHPVRTAFGVATLVYYAVLSIAGANDLIPLTFGLDMMAFTRALQVAVIALPILSFVITHRWCLRLQLNEVADRVMFAATSGVTVTHDGYVVPRG
ncbi:MAG TPA: cytochrome bc complex cytochrome b subunit [Mycobacteriales bacterium]|nr:cytochrome bc complex cytochrome b subunit [Mycobacteriales bacterium]